MEGRQRFRDPGRQKAFEARQAAEAAENAQAPQEKPVSEVRQRVRDRKDAAEAGYELGEKNLGSLEEFDDLSRDVERLLDQEDDWQYLLGLAPGELPIGESDLIKSVLEQAKREKGFVSYSDIARQFLEVELSNVKISIDAIKQAGIDAKSFRQMKEIEDLIDERFSFGSLQEQAA